MPRCLHPQGAAGIGFVGIFAKAVKVATPLANINVAKSLTLTTGTGSNQANEWWADERTVTGASETINIQDGTLTNMFGDTITLSSVKILFIQNTSVVSGEKLTITGDWAVTKLGTMTNFLVHPGGYHIAASPVDGFAVTATSADQITIDPGAATIKYNSILVGVT